jgi:short-subunit dehydrogenase
MSDRNAVLITGASAGIGRELALVFASEGHDLVLVARSRDKLEALAHEVKHRYGRSASVIAIDLTADGAARSLYDACMRGDVVYINGTSYELMVQWRRLQPRWLVRTVTGFLARRYAQ